MYHYVFSDAMHVYTRITKLEARNLWGKRRIALCPHRLRPGFPFAMHMEIPIETAQEKEFHYVLSEFTHYNCINYETGYYPAFYLVSERVNHA